MKLTFEKNGTRLEAAVEGRLDTTTAPELESALKAQLPEVTDVVLNFNKLDYISSAGLRVLLSTQKAVSKKGSLTITGANENVMEVFDITGFADILNIQ